MRRTVLFALIVLSQAAWAQKPATVDRWQPTRDAAERFLKERGVAGVAVAVAKDGKIIWEEGFGWANREKMIPATPNTMFSLASISKPITATGLMTLVQRGQIKLDQPANDYLGVGKLTGLAGDASGATVRRVLSHTAGLPLHYQFFYANEATRRAPTMDETIARYGILVTAPGETFQYSNLGFGIIDYIISRASGMAFADFMRTRVFLPLGMTHTSIDIAPGLEPYAAERYWPSNQKPVSFYTFDHVGASAVWSSAHDLVRFGMFHLKNRLPDQRAILADSSIDEMKKPVHEAFGAEYALGWVVHRNQRGRPLIEHSGGMPGVSTILNLYPSDNVVITVLTNGSLGWGSVADEAASAVLPGYADSLKAERARAKPPEPAKFTAPAELIGTWTGTIRTWAKTLPFELEMRPDGKVEVQLGEPIKPGFDPGPPKQLRALVNGVSYEKGSLEGRFAGTIPTPDVDWVPHTIALDLHLVNGVLRGSASAQTGNDPVFYSVASYVELRKR
ncbi:MAG: serine hydrolase domain-containing protein [Gemmatimonadota bacterium]